MMVMVCYRFHERGHWYIHKSCEEADIQNTVLEALNIEGVTEVKLYKLRRDLHKGR